MDSDKQIHVDVVTIVSFVIQSGQVSEGGVISMAFHFNLVKLKLEYTYLIQSQRDLSFLGSVA